MFFLKLLNLSYVISANTITIMLYHTSYITCYIYLSIHVMYLYVSGFISCTVYFIKLIFFKFACNGAWMYLNQREIQGYNCC